MLPVADEGGYGERSVGSRLGWMGANHNRSTQCSINGKVSIICDKMWTNAYDGCLNNKLIFISQSTQKFWYGFKSNRAAHDSSMETSIIYGGI